MKDLLVLIILALILGAAVTYLYREKKRGVRCVGCPDAGHCCRSCPSCSGKSGELPDQAKASSKEQRAENYFQASGQTRKNRDCRAQQKA